MLFNSLHFAAFFIVVFSLVALLRNRVKARNVVLLVAGYYFYGWWDWRFLFLLAGTTVIDYTCGRALMASSSSATATEDSPPQRTPRDRIFLIASLCANLGALAFFK